MWGDKKKIKELESKLEEMKDSLKEMKEFTYNLLGENGPVLSHVRKQLTLNEETFSHLAKMELWFLDQEGLEIEKH